MQQTAIKDPVSHSRMAHAERLLGRYPDIDPAEAGEILDFMQNAPALEVGLLTCKDHLKGPIARFRRDHRHEFEINWKKTGLYWLFAALILFVIGSVYSLNA